MSKYQEAKALVRQYFDDLEAASADTAVDVLKTYMPEDYLWRGVYPFRDQKGVEDVADIFWKPLKNALTHMQRRQDIFIGGTNEISGEIWVMSMGNFMGLFDNDWLGIPRTRKIANLRYAEFSCVQNGKMVSKRFIGKVWLGQAVSKMELVATGILRKFLD